MAVVDLRLEQQMSTEKEAYRKRSEGRRKKLLPVHRRSDWEEERRCWLAVLILDCNRRHDGLCRADRNVRELLDPSERRAAPELFRWPKVS